MLRVLASAVIAVIVGLALVYGPPALLMWFLDRKRKEQQ